MPFNGLVLAFGDNFSYGYLGRFTNFEQAMKSLIDRQDSISNEPTNRWFIINFVGKA